MQNIKEFDRDSVVVEPANQANATVIMLHGLGADAGDLSAIAPYLQSAQNSIRFIFPNAPLLPVSLNGGMLMPAWYDILGMSEDSKQDEAGIRKAHDHIEKLIHAEHEKGIPYKNIFIGGFSQGGALALFSGLHCSEKLGGIIGLSTYLPIADKLMPQHQALPVFMAHGSRDNMVPMRWAKMAVDALKQFGCDVEWKEFPIEHTINEDEALALKSWLHKQIITD